MKEVIKDVVLPKQKRREIKFNDDDVNSDTLRLLQLQPLKHVTIFNQVYKKFFQKIQQIKMLYNVLQDDNDDDEGNSNNKNKAKVLNIKVFFLILVIIFHH